MIDERCALGRQQNLAAVTDSQESSDLIDRWAEVVAFTLVGGTAVNRGAHAQSVDRREILGSECSLRSEHCGDSIFGARERAAERIADCLENASAMLRDRRSQNRIVASHRLLHRRTVALPSCRAAFDIREGKRDGTGRKRRFIAMETFKGEAP